MPDWHSNPSNMASHGYNVQNESPRRANTFVSHAQGHQMATNKRESTVINVPLNRVEHDVRFQQNRPQHEIPGFSDVYNARYDSYVGGNTLVQGASVTGYVLLFVISDLIKTSRSLQMI